ncbi:MULTISPECIES: TetR/AcrR family transcriptional regulator [unclassified Pseudofrankia]|uniref:TetR/AcrR family transcriptional regulator n=1 Tax=unclassified Pseudofrankia TaxID=2994372 RepID=UPI0008D98AFD|nr:MULTISPECIES: TetR/AcrR family transcriptional regulator [unclassified Pseudofrankia]MDT3439417.1 TetR/AcrR family transcriptional regulator [Pseudofrankia sp. BMG5.37]OHV48810.1 hypothetical protein BCD48_14330 [Pseudofrankia sp. BMG5.36]
MPFDPPADREQPGPPLSPALRESRARMLAAARTVFERDGFHAARVTDIVHLGGLAHGGFYRYFESKEAAFQELAREASARLGTPLDGLRFEPGRLDGLDELMRASVRRYLEAYRLEARFLGLITQISCHDAEVRAIRADSRMRAVARHVEPVRQLQRAGLAESQVSPERMLLGLIGMVEGFADRSFPYGALDRDLATAVDQLSRLCLRAMRLPRGGDLPVGPRV